MSDVPSSAACLASAMRNENPRRETFQRFYEAWIVEQNQNLHDLIAASKSNNVNNASTSSSQTEPADDAHTQTLLPLIDLVLEHYEHYYRAKSWWAKHDVLSVYSPPWRSSLEEAFLWIGGWRPSMAFHLLYSKSGLQLEAQLEELFQGLRTGDLGDLSAVQLVLVDELQRKTIKVEKDISEELAKHQQTIADSSMVQISQVATELRRRRMENNQVNNGREEQRIESALESKKEGLIEILEMADDLRRRTLKAMIAILTPKQAVHFLIAAAELHLHVYISLREHLMTIYSTSIFFAMTETGISSMPDNKFHPPKRHEFPTMSPPRTRKCNSVAGGPGSGRKLIQSMRW